MKKQAKHPIGTGEGSHGGHGRGQGGAGNWGGGVAESNQPAVGGGKHGGKGYNTEAHSGLYHGKDGEAVGHHSDIKPMHYDSKLHLEGDGNLPHSGHGARSPRAEHHPAPSGEAHSFNKHPAHNSHGYGHGVGQHKGPLRMSGHAKAHRIGCK